MKPSITRSALFAAALLLFTSLSPAAEDSPGASGGAKAAGNVKTTSVKAASPAAIAKANKAAAKAAAKLVDINSAGKTELKTLPGVSDEMAEKIIAGRPYGSKAQLLTRNIITGETYAEVRSLVIAKQKQTVTAKAAK